MIKLTATMSTTIADFQREILNSITGRSETGSETKSLNLVRKHDKNLSEVGDFSFPSLSNSKVWGNLGDLNHVRTNLLKSPGIDRIEEQKDVCSVFLNQEYTLGKLFGSSGESEARRNEISPSDQTVDHGNLDLTAARAAFVSDILGRCTERIGETKSEPEKRILQVGPVLDGSKKKTKLTLSEYKTQVQETLEALDEQRREPGETKEEEETRLMNLVNAQVLFDLVSSAPSSQCTINKGSNTASFVLYNNARISQILVSFQHSVDQGVYPSLPSTLNYTLLTEDEEWEICFVYLLPYLDIMKDVVQHQAVHRIPLHLVGLSKCLSRYYSRVKVLRDPLPKLIPVIHARILFLKEVQKIFKSSFRILGLQALEKM